MNYKMFENEDLMLAYSRNDSLAFKEFYSRFSNKIYSYFYLRISKKDSAKDLTQEFFKKIHANKSRYLYPSNLNMWLYTIAHNLLVSYYRYESLRRCENFDLIKNDLPMETDNRQDVYNEHLKIIREVIDDLPETQKKAITMRYFEGSSFDQISSTLNKSTTNIRKIISRAKLNMQLNTKILYSET